MSLESCLFLIHTLGFKKTVWHHFIFRMTNHQCIVRHYYYDRISLCFYWITTLMMIISCHDHYSISAFVIQQQPSITKTTISYFNNDAVVRRHNNNDQQRQQERQRKMRHQKQKKHGLNQLNVIPHDLIISTSHIVSSSSLSSISSSIQHTIATLLPDMFASSSSSSTILSSTTTVNNLPNILNSYRSLLQTYPISTKTITASILACIGDSIAQYRAYQQLEKQNYISYQQTQLQQQQQQLQQQLQQPQLRQQLQQQLLYSSVNAVSCPTCDDNNYQCDHNDDHDSSTLSEDNINNSNNNRNSNNNNGYQPMTMMMNSNTVSRNNGVFDNNKRWSHTRMNAFNPRNNNNNDYTYNNYSNNNNNNAMMSLPTRLSSSLSSSMSSYSTNNSVDNTISMNSDNDNNYKPLIYQYDITRGIVFLLFGAMYTGLFQHYWFTYMSNHITTWGQQVGIWDQSYKTGNTFSIQVLRAILDGTRQHEWFTCFDIKLHMELPPSPLAIAIGKVMVNQFVVVPTIYMPLFFTLTNIVAKLNMKQSIERIQSLYFPILFRNYIFWLPVQFIQFLFVPIEWQIPLQAVASLVWTIILSSSVSSTSSPSPNTSNTIDQQQQQLQQPIVMMQGSDAIFTTSSDAITRNVQILQQQTSDVFASLQQSQQQQVDDGDNISVTASASITTTGSNNQKTTNEILDDARIKDVIPERVLDTMKEVFVDNKVGIASSGFAFGLLSAAADDAMLGTAVGSMMGTEADVGVAIMSAVGAGVSIWSANANAAYNANAAAVVAANNAAEATANANAATKEEQQQQLLLVPHDDDDDDTTTTTDNSNKNSIIDPMIEMQKVVDHIELSNNTSTETTIIVVHEDLIDVSDNDMEIPKINDEDVTMMRSTTFTTNDTFVSMNNNMRQENRNHMDKDDDDCQNHHPFTASHVVVPTTITTSSSNVLKTSINSNVLHEEHLDLVLHQNNMILLGNNMESTQHDTIHDDNNNDSLGVNCRSE